MKLFKYNKWYKFWFHYITFTSVCYL